MSNVVGKTMELSNGYTIESATLSFQQYGMCIPHIATITLPLCHQPTLEKLLSRSQLSMCAVSVQAPKSSSIGNSAPPIKPRSYPKRNPPSAENTAKVRRVDVQPSQRKRPVNLSHMVRVTMGHWSTKYNLSEELK